LQEFAPLLVGISTICI